MSCKEILPQINVDGISIKQQKAKVSDYPFSFSPDADEAYDLTISHTNLIQIDDFLGAFSLNDVLDATVGPSSFYNVKFLFTDNAESFKLITDAIRLVEEVSFFLHGTSQTATAQEVLAEKEKINKGEAPANPAVKAAAEALDKCAFKLAKKKQTIAPDQQEQQDQQQEQNEPQGQEPPATKNLTPSPKKIQTVIEQVIEALVDNKANRAKLEKYNIASFKKSLKVDEKKIELKGNPPTQAFVNSDLTTFRFAATQLKDLYMVIVPNVEYRENNKIVFTVRQYFPETLVQDYNPMSGIEVELLSQTPVVDLTKLFFSLLLEGNFSEKQVETYMQNLKQKSVVSNPELSLGYNGEINGIFFLNMKNLAENLTSYKGLLEQPELYKQILQGILVKKVYDDGTEKQLDTPVTINGLSYKDNMIRGYRFTDEYDLQNFHYVISIDAKNPLEFLLKYVMPKLEIASKIVDDLNAALLVAKKVGSTTILNPVSGYFTDDFLNSSFYTSYSTKYAESYLTLVSLYNFLLPGEPLPTTNAPKLTNTQQLLTLQELYANTIKKMKDIADTEGISVETQGSYSSRKKAAKNVEPYKTISQTFSKSYKATTSPVFFDFLYPSPPATAGGTTSSGYEVMSEELISRIDLETQLLNNFALTNAKNDYTANDPISITPLSITMDQVTVNLIQPNTVEEEEELATRTLMSAELEVKDPTHKFSKKGDVLTKLLELEGTKVVVPSNKTLRALSDADNFIPTDLKNAIPTSKSGTKFLFSEATLQKAVAVLNMKAAGELAKQTSKALFLDEADEDPFFLANAVLSKLDFFNDGTAVDPKHSFVQKAELPESSATTPKAKSIQNVLAMLKTVELIKDFYKNNPASFITRFMNSYQLEYVVGVDDNFEIKYAPLTKTVIGELPAGQSKLVRMRMRAGVPISNKYTELHSSFLLTNAVTQLPVLSIYSFLPNLTTTPIQIIIPAKIKVEQISRSKAELTTRDVVKSPPNSSPATTRKPSVSFAFRKSGRKK
tara:strand:+ start:2551 stop:5583 length:3033 start_codon:yes stop_codon:yes gene_type:complete